MKRATLLGGLALLMLLSLVVGVFAETYFTGATLIGPVLIAGVVVVASAALGRSWAIKAMVLAFAIVPSLASLSGSDRLATGTGVMFYGALLVVGLGNLGAALPLLRTVPALSFLLYYVFAVTSAAWSQDRVMTVGTAGGLLSLYVFALGAVARLGVRDTLRAITIALGVGVGLSAVLFVVAPSLAVWKGFNEEPRLKGITGHPGRMSEMASLFLLCMWVTWRDRLMPRLLAVGGSAVGTACLWLTYTRSVIVLAVVAVVATMRSRVIAAVGGFVLLVGAIWVILTVPTALDSFASFASRSGQVEGGLTLSGRTGLWNVAVDRFVERPWIGYGFYQHVIFNEAALLKEDSADATAHAHNVILQSLVSVGLIGTMFLIPVYWGQIRHLLKYPLSPLSPFIAFFLFIGMVKLGGYPTRADTTSMAFQLMCVAGLAAAQLERIKLAASQGVPRAPMMPPRYVAAASPGRS
jgi:exopolysaccharide production protein ExoQ